MAKVQIKTITHELFFSSFHNICDTISCVKFSRDARCLYIGSTDGTVHKLNIGSAGHVHLDKDFSLEHDGGVICLATVHDRYEHNILSP